MTEELDCGAGMQNEEELDVDFDFFSLYLGKELRKG